MALNLLGGGRQPKSLVEFRAGKMTQTGNMVNPDKRKGLVYIYQSDDGLIHFSWKDRTTGIVEDDLIVFPEDTVYQKVSQCKEGSRVFMLKFKASSRKLFFWMQEPKSEGDDDYVRSVNDSLNGKVHASDSSNVTPSASEQEMQNLLGSMSQSQLMQLLGGMSEMGGGPGLLAQLNQLAPGLASMGGSGGSSGGTATETASGGSNNSGGPKPQSLLKVKKPSTTPAPKASSGSSAPGPIQLEDLQSCLNRIQPSAAGAGVQVDLAAGVNADVIRRITSCESTVKKLFPLLPQFGGPETTTEAIVVEDTLKSPQFQSALSAFCAAFATGSLGPLISQFGFQAEAVTAAENGNLEAFINAIQKETIAAATDDVVEDMQVD